MSYSKTIPLSWLRDNLWDPIASEPEKKDEILERVKDNLSSFEDDGIILTADNVGVHMALEVFELRRAFEWDEWKLKDEQLFDVPDHLNSYLRNIATVNGLARRAEAYSRRLILDHILVNCIIEETKGTVDTELAGQSQTPTQQQPDRIILMFKSDMGPLSVRIDPWRQPHLVTGRVDYMLLFGTESQNEPVLVVVAVDQIGWVGAACGRIVTNMAIVHRNKQQARCINTRVYGLVTDSDEFRFWQINNESRVSESRPYVWHLGDAKLIISILRFMIRTSAQSSPATVASYATSATTIQVEEQRGNRNVSGTQSSQVNNEGMDGFPDDRELYF